VDLAPPTAKFMATSSMTGGETYRYETAVTRSTIDDQDILVTGPKNFSQLAKLVSVSRDEDRAVLATYEIEALGGLWDSADTGAYTITLQTNQISDFNNNFIPLSVLDTFQVSLPISDSSGGNKTEVLWYDRLIREVELWLRDRIETLDTESLGSPIAQIGNLTGDKSAIFCVLPDRSVTIDNFKEDIKIDRFGGQLSNL
jgi:hypothetical protein